MLKTRPRVLLGVIFFSVNIVALSDQPAFIDSELELVIIITSHYLPLPSISQLTRWLFTYWSSGAAQHISVLPITCQHQSPSYRLPFHPTTPWEIFSFLSWIVIDWSWLVLPNLSLINWNLSDAPPDEHNQTPILLRTRFNQ